MHCRPWIEIRWQCQTLIHVKTQTCLMLSLVKSKWNWYASIRREDVSTGSWLRRTMGSCGCTCWDFREHYSTCSFLLASDLTRIYRRILLSCSWPSHFLKLCSPLHTSTASSTVMPTCLNYMQRQSIGAQVVSLNWMQRFCYPSQASTLSPSSWLWASQWE